ncbi:hypothetical protein ACEPAH_3881 [Sanghuangporus vaninii]
MVLLTRKLASRKFIDFINLAACKSANWDPTISVEPEDYGAVDRETGQFQKEGNIFHETEIADIVSKYSLITGPRIDDYITQCLNVTSIKVASGARAGALGTAKPTIGGQWQFGSKRGALLLYGSRITRLPKELFEELKETKWGHGKHIVSHIHSCPAYALYLSDRKTVTIDLRADVPLGSAPGVGITQAGLPVKEIKKRRGRRHQSPDPFDDDKEDWIPIEVPWNILDDDGKEMVEVSDDDSDLEEECYFQDEI